MLPISASAPHGAALQSDTAQRWTEACLARVKGGALVAGDHLMAHRAVGPVLGVAHVAHLLAKRRRNGFELVQQLPFLRPGAHGDSGRLPQSRAT